MLPNNTISQAKQATRDARKISKNAKTPEEHLKAVEAHKKAHGINMEASRLEVKYFGEAHNHLMLARKHEFASQGIIVNNKLQRIAP